MLLKDIKDAYQTEMSDDKSTSLINFGNLSKPRQIKRVAKAKAEADLISEKSGIAISDLHRRAIHGDIEEEAIHQKNMESIIGKALAIIRKSFGRS